MWHPGLSEQDRYSGLKNASNTQYTFAANKLKFEGKHTVEGRIMYNENTIIFYPEKISDNGKEIKNTSDLPYVMYYTLSGDELRLEQKLQFLPIWENTGTYHKID